MAPAQTGTHDGGRQTWGHSLIINPWGEILADGGEAEGISIADINLADLPKARHRIPSITIHRIASLGNFDRRDQKAGCGVRVTKCEDLAFHVIKVLDA